MMRKFYFNFNEVGSILSFTVPVILEMKKSVGGCADILEERVKRGAEMKARLISKRYTLSWATCKCFKSN